jgi:preprotein translocase subunit SecA
MNPFKMLFGTKHSRDMKILKPILQKVNELEPKMQAMTDEHLKQQTHKFKDRAKNGESLESLMPEAFATVREAAKRVLGMRPYDVQIIGAAVLFQGRIAEMKTGEGKTLTATMPMYLHALSGRGCHLVTVNDYLAARDAEEMGVLYRWLGLTVGCITNDLDDDERHEMYACDITYGTNNEFAFDYLRDNMKFDLKDYVQRGHNFCIVDEVDSILIDEARTPLLISGAQENSNVEMYGLANGIIPKLTIEKHYTVDEKSHSAVFTEEGISELQKLLKKDDLFNVENSELLHHLNQALKAHTLFKLEVNYVVKDGKVIIVDEFTGRLKEGSRWSDGLHQAVEAKEGVEIKSENQTLASITFQNYFKLYNALGGMTGTADTEAEEFDKIYNLDVVVIPTNEPIARIDEPDVVYKTAEAKIKAVCQKIKELHEKGQPVLVGTISIESSEIIGKALSGWNIPHEVLNAKQHEREANIIANAGQKGAVTIATNMAGRGTDIKLTDETKAAGGLFILGTERHESRRIDNQLRGRSGRQGDPGGSKFFVSLEDDLMRIFGSSRIKDLMTTMGMKDDEPIEHKMITNAIAKAQKKVETHNFEIRKHLLEYDNVMNEQRKVIYKIRKDILSDNDNMGFIHEMIEDVADVMVESYRPERKVPIDSWSWDEMTKSFQVVFNTDAKVDANTCIQKYDSDPTDYFAAEAKEILKKKFEEYDDEQVIYAIREVLLSIFDKHWKDHLRAMDHMKEGINLRAYAQKDPLIEYKREGFDLFHLMKDAVKKSVVENIFSVKLYTKEEIEELKRKQQEILEMQLKAAEEAEQRAREEEAMRLQAAAQAAKGGGIRRSQAKVGRNDPCPCGSGKKFKQCHGK